MAGISRAEANARLATVNIKGKEYVQVNARILAFWDVFPEGQIATEWLVLDDAWCVCKATVSNMGVVLATGTAFEVRSAGAINKTSYIENCETSAIGRALGIAGIGTDGAIASAEEVLGAVAQQERIPENAGMVDIAAARSAYETALRNYCQRAGKDMAEVRAKQEEHFKAPWTSWSVEMLNAVADKFPKAVSHE